MDSEEFRIITVREEIPVYMDLEQAQEDNFTKYQLGGSDTVYETEEMKIGDDIIAKTVKHIKSSTRLTVIGIKDKIPERCEVLDKQLPDLHIEYYE